MGLTLFGRGSSVNVQKVLWALAELEVDYEQIVVGGRHGGLDTDAFGALNPNRRIPVIDEDGMVLWESHSILRYLAARHGGEAFWPNDARERAVIDQWTDWTATTFQPAWSAVFMQIVRTAPRDHDRKAIDDAVTGAERCFAILDRRLEATGAFLAGPALSYADIAAGVCLHRWTTMDFARSDFPAVEDWHARLMDRPAYREKVVVSYEELRAR